MLARLRRDLDLMPSPVEDRPGLLMRDPFHYSDATLIVPSELVQCLEFFDGEKSELDLREYLVRSSGQLDVNGLIDHLRQTLSKAGFLEDETFAQLKEDKQRAFAAAPVRRTRACRVGLPGRSGLSCPLPFPNTCVGRLGLENPAGPCAPSPLPM